MIVVLCSAFVTTVHAVTCFYRSLVVIEVRIRVRVRLWVDFFVDFPPAFFDSVLWAGD